jgi:hypothetical protein
VEKERQAEKLKRTWEGKASVLVATTYPSVEIFKNKAPSLHWQRDQDTEVACRRASFEIEQLREFEKSQSREFWDP